MLMLVWFVHCGRRTASIDPLRGKKSLNNHDDKEINMPIISLRTNSPGQNFQAPRACFLQSSDTLAAITTAGYLNPYLQMQSIALYPTDFVMTSGSNGNFVYKPVFAANGTITLTVLP
jgi:hypothetical protein